jgi:hypothetical protein
MSLEKIDPSFAIAARNKLVENRSDTQSKHKGSLLKLDAAMREQYCRPKPVFPNQKYKEEEMMLAADTEQAGVLTTASEQDKVENQP